MKNHKFLVPQTFSTSDLVCKSYKKIMATSLENIPVKYSNLISEIETGQVKIPQFSESFYGELKHQPS